MTIIATFALLIAFTAGDQPSIEDLRSDLGSFVGYRLTLCGEVSADHSTIYSDTVSHFHGRLGIKLRGYGSAGRGKCITGYLVHEDYQKPIRRGEPRTRVVTDAPVHPDYVFIVATR